nr:hypothetical protein [Tanacetum cinerariifolium]
MHKEDQQATGGPTSLGVTSEEKANPQLSSVDSTAKADPELSAPNDFIPHFKDLDSPEDDHVITVDDSDEDDEDVYTPPNVKTEDTLVPKSSSPMSSQIQELTNQVLILQSQMHKLEAEKNKAEAEAALLKAQPSFPNVEQLNELLVKSVKSEFLKILSTHNFSSSLPTKLKDLPSKFNDLTEKWELPAEFLAMPSQVEMVQAKLKTLDALPSLLNKVTNALNQFAQAITSNKTRGDSVPLAGQAGTLPDGKHIHLTEEQINQQKKIEEEAKAEAAKHKSEDPLDKLNDLTNKKRKHADDIHDYFKANKRLKSSVQYEDHLLGIVLNKPVLGMILFNSYHRQDFVTVEDFRDFPNTMLYNV